VSSVKGNKTKMKSNEKIRRQARQKNKGNEEKKSKWKQLVWV